MRTVVSFDRPPPRIPAYQGLLYIDQGGTNQLEKNIYLACSRTVSEFLENRYQVYENSDTRIIMLGYV